MHTHICMYLFLHLSIYWKPWVHTNTSMFSLILHGSFKFLPFLYLWLYSLTVRKLPPITCKIFIWSNQFPSVAAITPFRLWHPLQGPLPPHTPFWPSQTPLPHTGPLWLFHQRLPSCPQLNYLEREEKEKLEFCLFKKCFSFHVCICMCLCLHTLLILRLLLLICLPLDGEPTLGRVLTRFAFYMRAKKDPL